MENISKNCYVRSLKIGIKLFFHKIINFVDIAYILTNLVESSVLLNDLRPIAIFLDYHESNDRLSELTFYFDILDLWESEIDSVEALEKNMKPNTL
jgi:hypothetical protein